MLSLYVMKARWWPWYARDAFSNSAVAGRGLIQDVALITDGRFSGGSHGFDVGHITPEAAKGGPIGIVENGDLIEIDAQKNSLNF